MLIQRISVLAFLIGSAFLHSASMANKPPEEATITQGATPHRKHALTRESDKLINDLKKVWLNYYEKAFEQYQKHLKDIKQRVKLVERGGDEDLTAAYTQYTDRLSAKAAEFEAGNESRKKKIKIDPHLVGYWDKIVYSETGRESLEGFVPVRIHETGEVVVLMNNIHFNTRAVFKGYIHDGYFKWAMPDLKALDGTAKIVAIKFDEAGKVQVHQGDYATYLNTGEYEQSLERTIDDKFKLKPDADERLQEFKRIRPTFAANGISGVSFSINIEELPTDDPKLLLKTKRYIKAIESAQEKRDKELRRLIPHLLEDNN